MVSKSKNNWFNGQYNSMSVLCVYRQRAGWEKSGTYNIQTATVCVAVALAMLLIIPYANRSQNKESFQVFIC